jgi:hypothetical protein
LVAAVPHGFASIAPMAPLTVAFKDSSSRFLEEVLTPVTNQ